MDTEKEVLERYAAAAETWEQALCCPVSYDDRYLKILPPEIIERDYGCGNPAAYVEEGDTVLDLGSGTGKICYIASQITGPGGRVIGIDFNPAMLSLAEKHRADIVRRIGWDNVSFHRGRIQDLKTDLVKVDDFLRQHPATNVEELAAIEAFCQTQRETAPLVADGFVDLILSNCVLNLVETGAKQDLFAEIYRVLKDGGRVAISDIVADQPVPEHLQKNPELWSGCISGAFEENAFLAAFETAGLQAVTVERRDEAPWRVVEGIAFHALTVTATKGKRGPAKPEAAGKVGTCC